MCLPVIEAQNDDEIGVQRFVGGNDQAAKRGPDAKRFEVVARHEFATGHVGLVVPAHGDVLLIVGDDGSGTPGWCRAGRDTWDRRSSLLSSPP